MPSRLFLQDAANALSGTFPTVEQSAVLTATCAAPTANTLRTMRSLTGTSRVVRSITSSATTVAQVGFCAMFCSDTLDVAQVIPPQILTFNIANRESSSSMNIGADMRINAYVWRPSTGTKVGTLVDALAMAGDVEPGAALSIRVNQASITSTITLSADAGDVLVCELWNLFTQSVGTALQCGLYWGGTTVNTTPNAVVTNHASFFELGTTSLTFGTPPVLSISGSFAQSLAPLTLAGVGTSPRNGSFGGSLAALTLAGVAAVPHTSSFSNTLGALTLSGTGQVGVATGTFSNTLAALTLAGVGSSPRNAAFSNTLGALTLAGTGAIPLSAAFSNTLADATLTATGSAAFPAVTGAFSNTLGTMTVNGQGAVPLTGAFSNTLSTVALSAQGSIPLAGTFSGTLADATLSGDGTVTDLPPAVGQFLQTLENAQLAATGTVLAPAPPATQQDPGAGSGASRVRKKFIIPTVEPVNPMDAILEPLQPPKKQSPVAKVAPMSMVTHLTVAPTPLPAPFIRPVIEEDEYSDDDMIMLALLV